MERYLIFGRTRYEEPLELQGDVEADTDEAAATAARARLGAGWVEVQLVPDSSIRWVITHAGETRKEEEAYA